MRRAAAILIALILDGCAGPPPRPPVPAPAPAPVAAANIAIVVAIRRVPRAALGQDPAAFGLTAPASSRSGAEAELVLREPDGRTRAVIALPPAGLRAGARVRLIDGGRRIARVDPR